ncbi:MAG TPA: flavodoxin family protein [archaeon]|nr:flavodoxin family protein [archaeon]
MKVLCILGSPRKKGNTAKILGWVEEELRSRGHQVEHLHIADHKLEGCVACYKCQIDPDELECSRDDEGVEIFRRLKEADVAVYATPLYCWGFTSQMKPFIDRHLCLCTGADDPSTYQSHIENKRMALLVTAADKAGEGNTDLIQEVFKRLTDYTKSRVVALLIVPFCTKPEDLGDSHREKARAFAAEIVG